MKWAIISDDFNYVVHEKFVPTADLMFIGGTHETFIINIIDVFYLN
jgi:hypothetical protein